MPDFNGYVARHGESWVQGIIEEIERKEGLRGAAGLSLEERWTSLMSQPAKQHPQIAA